MSKQRSRMDIQSESKLIFFHSNEHFFDYINKIGYEKDMNEKEFVSILKEYTNEKFIQINGYLREGDYSPKTESGIASIFLFGLPMMLHLFLLAEIKTLYYGLLDKINVRNLINIKEGTVVYRGIKTKPPSSWKVGDTFYFPEFVSTSLNKNIAKSFGNYIFIITLYGKGFKGIKKISELPFEDEVLICAYSKFKITKISGNYYYMDKY